ncbi:MAG: Cof-type HAD-IIB family hydrolase [Treponema sp.]|nr:Cof-type HAD-IIB family hydrolase [Treponema sp.]
MKPLRVLALDVDDTLLRSDLSISHRTRHIIKRTEQLGVTVVLASGRVPEAMEHSSRLLGLDKRPGYLVSNNGALIEESNSGVIIHEAMLESRLALAICDLADAEGFAMQMYQDDIMYVSRKNEYSDVDQRVTGFRQVVVENFRAMVNEGCYKLIIPGEPELLVHVESLLRTYLGNSITFFTSRPTFLEIMAANTNKGTALAKIAGILKLDAEEVMAIGDSMNDEAMIRWAGVGVAMANADERIKNIANVITEHSNDDDGIVEVLEKYFFGKGSEDE